MDVVVGAFIYGLTLFALYMPIAVGLNLIFGVLRILNFAHGDLYMLGGMFTWWLLVKTGPFQAANGLVPGLGFFLAAILAVALCAVLGITIERVLLRRLGAQVLPALIVSLGVGLMIQSSTLLIAGGYVKHYYFPLRGDLTLGGAHVSMERIAITILGVVAFALFYLLLKRTKLGRDIRAVAQDQECATLMGINPARIRTIAMALGTALAAMGGVLATSIFGAEPFMGHIPFVFSIVVIALGGLGSIEGAFFAGLLLGVAESFITVYIGAPQAMMFGFIVLYVVLMFRPNGLMGRKRLSGGYI